jgi:DNA-binding Xre family transcriptional regulator
MKDVGFEINKILVEKKIKKKEFSDLIGMSSVNLSKIINKKSIDAKLLEKIANTLEVPVIYFFEDTEVGKKIISNSSHVSIGSANSNNNSYADKDLSHKLELCNNSLEALKKELALKNEIIELLKNKNTK